jgi:cysteine synthase A
MDFGRIKIYESLEQKVGNTPLYEIKKIPIPNRNRIFAKEEFLNPTASNFDRVYPYLFRVAEEKGFIVPGITPVIEASTGNAGASFAWCAKKLRYTDATVITHKDTPKARVEQIKSYGAKIIFSPAGELAAGYVHKLDEILAEDKKQKGGKIGENPKRMYAVTKIGPEGKVPFKQYVEEAIKQLRGTVLNTHFDYFICAVGSGTMISGVGEAFKKLGKHTKIVAIETAEVPAVSSLKKRKMLPTEQYYKHYTASDFPFGMGAAGLPQQKLDINFSVIDDIQGVRAEEWKNALDALHQKEDKQVGRTSGAELAVALRMAKDVFNKIFLITFHDASWKYENSYQPERFKV